MYMYIEYIYILTVVNAFSIMAIVMAIFSVVAFDLFSATDPYNFGTFSRSYFSMFQARYPRES